MGVNREWPIEVLAEEYLINYFTYKKNQKRRRENIVSTEMILSRRDFSSTQSYWEVKWKTTESRHMKLASGSSFSRAVPVEWPREKAPCSWVQRCMGCDITNTIWSRSLQITERREVGIFFKEGKSSLWSHWPPHKRINGLQNMDGWWRKDGWQRKLKWQERMNHQPNKLRQQRMSSRAQEGRLASVQRERTFSLSAESEATEIVSLMQQGAGSCRKASIPEEEEARMLAVSTRMAGWKAVIKVQNWCFGT